MGFFSGGNINVVKLAELAAQELSMYAIAKQMGHSISGIRDCAERNNIAFTVCSKFKYINVDGVKMTTNDACESKGFKATSLYAWRVKRGLNEQDGFNAYVEYQKTKTTKHPVLTVDTCTVKYKKETYSLKSACKMLGLHLKSVNAYMKQNKYTQASFDRLCYAKGKL